MSESKWDDAALVAMSVAELEAQAMSRNCAGSV